MKLISILILLLAVSDAFSQQEWLTTFIFVRHAEKESAQGKMMTKDPVLSNEGKTRAQHLAEVLSKTEIASVYSTPYQRTRQTVGPLAQAKSLEVKEYDPATLQEIDRMLNDNKGKTAVVCGHSNTIPRLANYLTGKETYSDFAENDFGNLLIICVYERGKPACATWLKY
ncbi:MAG: hypothetical protein OJF59_000140 [Cytophagales bacterium]|jgi:broad specificity phosphatase PhoE|nr:histidine phosphatase family protein [Bacteroidota bacterium]MBS1982138.1 histidine phosphatase family protein [Bacteroidota bacterium]WHZ06387.1 MAG: hypothetical protein OJF59_000140 [Cytophagales bacterium]